MSDRKRNLEIGGKEITAYVRIELGKLTAEKCARCGHDCHSPEDPCHSMVTVTVAELYDEDGNDIRPNDAVFKAAQDELRCTNGSEPVCLECYKFL